MSKLNPKQLKFCEEYVVDLNATQAAIRAGYSKKTANEQGARLLANVSVKKYIKSLKDNLREKTGITAEKIVNELALIGFHNTQDFIRNGNMITALKQMDRKKVAAVSKIKTTKKSNGDSVTEISFYDKVSALELLGKHVGAWEKDNAQKRTTVKVVGYAKDED